MKGMRTRDLVYCALFSALIAVFAQIQVPLPGLVPISLATFGIMIAGLLLGWKYGLLAAAVYVLLGAGGVPVFAGFKGGLAALTGPTGGYIIGYMPYAALAGLPVKKCQDAFWGRCGLLALGTLVCYTLGTAWFMVATGRTLGESMGLCVLPFLPGDAVKTALAAFLAPKLRKAKAAK
ncbi:MAG: biotin transporter BioY [Clostridia bacterium]|nr:biotin transporter BioY [Clostridia bacterium]